MISHIDIILLYANIIMSHVDIDKSQVYLIMLHMVTLFILHVGDRSMLPYLTYTLSIHFHLHINFIRKRKIGYRYTWFFFNVHFNLNSTYTYRDHLRTKFQVLFAPGTKKVMMYSIVRLEGLRTKNKRQCT